MEELFRGPDRTFCPAQIRRKDRAFKKELVEHVHLLLEKQATKYQRNRVFGRTLERLKDPQQEVCFRLSQVIKS